MQSIEALLSQLHGVKRRSDTEWDARCPGHDDNKPSLGVRIEGTKILLHCLAGCKPEAIVEAIGWRMSDLFTDKGSKTNGSKPPTPAAPERVTCAPGSAAPTPVLAHPAHGKPTALHVYKTADNMLLGYVMRFDSKDGKTFCPYTYSTADGWQLKAFSKPRPLYGLERLRLHAGTAAIVVEGEKGADACQALAPRNACLTWCGGAGAVKHADFSPLYGLPVILWPDADPAGREAMAALADLLLARGGTVRIVDTEGLPDGFDAADLNEPLGPWLKPRLRAVQASAPTPPVQGPEPAREAPAAAVDVPAAIENAKDDPGALFEPAVLDALQQMRRDAPAEYQRLRAQVKETAASVSELDRLTGPKASVTPITEGRTLQQAKPKADPADDYTPFADDVLAKAFTAAHPELRYVAAWNCWMQWDDLGWHRDTTLHVFDLARKLCAEVASVPSGATPSQVAAAKSAGKRAAIENLARADRVHASTPERWDADIYLLNTPGGVVDLRTGNMRPVRMDDYCLNVTNATPRDIPTPKWDAFLSQTTGDDAAMIGYLHRMGGYALTGDTREDFLGFIYGPGGNGKSVFMDTLQHLLGTYAVNAGMDTFTESKPSSHSEDVARLAGARLVIAQETEQGRRWNEQRVLALTGSGKITARRLYEASIEFQPQCKLIFSGNHKPALRNVGDNFRRRFNIIPFTRKPDVVNKGLRNELWAERDGILFKFLVGCMAWQCDGLQPPDAVIATTADYFSNQDILGQWIVDKCELSAVITGTGVRALYPSYVDFCKSMNEFWLRQGEFREALLLRPGIKKGGSTKNPTIDGIRVRVDAGTHAERFGD
jgi:P4 family phage/plasmid primase-like protien